MQRRRSGLCGRVRLCAVIASVSASGLGCGETISNRPDAAVSVPDGAAPDAAVPRCDPRKDFGDPVRLENVNSAGVEQSAVLVDELTLYFGRSPADGSEGGLYVANRDSANSPFRPPTQLQSSLNAAGPEAGPSVTGNGLMLFYYVGGDAVSDIYVAGRENTAMPFPVGAPVPQINMPGVADLEPFVTADGAALYFGSSRGGTELNLFVSVRQGDGMYGAPQQVEKVNTPQPESHPVVSRDGLTIYWSSARTDGGIKGGTEIWRATRSSTAAAFGTPLLVPELNSTDNDAPSWLAPDGCSILLHSTRPGGLGAQDIYEAVKPM